MTKLTFTCKVDFKPFHDALEKAKKAAIEEMADEGERVFMLTTRTFDTPTWVVKRKRAKGYELELMSNVPPRADIPLVQLLNWGVKNFHAIIDPIQQKTAPGRLRAQPGFWVLQQVTRKPIPGAEIKPRRFDEETAKELKKTLPPLMTAIYSTHLR